MSQFHLLFQKVESPSEVTSEDSTVKAASAVSQKIFHHQLTPNEKKIAGPAMHYGFGASIPHFTEPLWRSRRFWGGEGEPHSARRSGWART